MHSGTYLNPRRFASRRTAPSTWGSIRMAMRRRAAAPKGGRPMRRIAPSCPEDTSGISEKSIPPRRIGLALLPTRSPRADDADAFAIASPPHCIGHDEHAAGCRTAESQGSSLPLGMMQIRTIEGLGIAEHGRGLFERDSVLGAVYCSPSERPTRT